MHTTHTLATHQLKLFKTIKNLKSKILQEFLKTAKQQQLTKISHEGRHEQNVSNDGRQMVLGRLLSRFPTSYFIVKAFQKSNTLINLTEH